MSDYFDPGEGIIWNWAVYAPEGFTKTGLEHRFRESTTQKLEALAEETADSAYQDLVQVMEEVFTEGNSAESGGYIRAVESLRYDIQSSSAGVNVQFTMDVPHALQMTGAAGGPVDYEDIEAKSHGYLRFYWKNPPPEVGPPGIYYRKRVGWMPRNRQPGEDPIAETLGAYADRFAHAMLDAHQRAWVELTSNEVQYGYTGRSQRVR